MRCTLVLALLDGLNGDGLDGVDGVDGGEVVVTYLVAVVLSVYRTCCCSFTISLLTV